MAKAFDFNLNNPFDASFGQVPIAKTFLDYEPIAQSMAAKVRSTRHRAWPLFITGVRGSGKTVLMRRVMQILKSQDDNHVLVVSLTDIDNLLEELYLQLHNYTRSMINSISSVEVNGFGVSISQEVHDQTYYRLEILKMLRTLDQKGLVVAVFLDEVTSSKSMKALAKLFSEAKGNDLSISLIMTGLLKNVNRLSETKDLTFLYRAQRYVMEPLTRRAMSKAYQSIFELSEVDSKKLADLTKGYAYAFQLLGSMLYSHQDLDVMKLVVDQDFLLDFQDQLGQSAYSVIVKGLGKQQLEYLVHVAKHQSISQIAKDMGVKMTALTPVRQKMIDELLVTPVARGIVNLTLPFFGEFVSQYYQVLLGG